MARYGLWTPYINEPKMFDWYSLPEELQAELDAYAPDGTELNAMAPERFRSFCHQVVAYANASVPDLPDHGPKHFREVKEAGMAAAAMYEQLTGRFLPLAVKQALAAALYQHDCHHGGSTLRADVRTPALLFRPELGTRVSVEWVSSLAINEFGQRHDLPLPWRIFQMMVVWCSTFGGNQPRARELGIPDVQPEGLWGCLMRAADVWLAPDIRDCIRKAAAVKYGEVPIETPPTTARGFIEAQLGFCSYVRHCHDRLDEMAGVPVTRELGWRDTVHRHEITFSRLLAGREPELMRFTEQQLAAYYPVAA